MLRRGKKAKTGGGSDSRRLRGFGASARRNPVDLNVDSYDLEYDDDSLAGGSEMGGGNYDYIHSGVASLIGDDASAISLDGQSLLLPPESGARVTTGPDAMLYPYQADALDDSMDQEEEEEEDSNTSVKEQEAMRARSLVSGDGASASSDETGVVQVDGDAGTPNKHKKKDTIASRVVGSLASSVNGIFSGASRKQKLNSAKKNESNHDGDQEERVQSDDSHSLSRSSIVSNNGGPSRQPDTSIPQDHKPVNFMPSAITACSWATCDDQDQWTASENIGADNSVVELPKGVIDMPTGNSKGGVTYYRDKEGDVEEALVEHTRITGVLTKDRVDDFTNEGSKSQPETAEPTSRSDSNPSPPTSSENVVAAAMKEGKRREKRSCLPLYIRNAPAWIKCALFGSCVLFILAVVLVSITLGVYFGGNDENGEGSSGIEQGDAGEVNPATLVPTLTPVVATASPTSEPVPTTAPTFAPTGAPTVYDENIVRFFVTGGRYPEALRSQAAGLLALLPQIPYTSLFHLGDWNSPSVTNCHIEAYEEVAELFSHSSVPVYFVVGDNEYNDCSADPDQAIANWRSTLIGNEARFWDPPSWDVVHADDPYPENFAYRLNDVTFVGINLVAGTVHDEDEWEERQLEGLEWIRRSYNEFWTRDGVIVLFVHASPLSNPRINFFFSDLFEQIEDRYDDIHFVIIHKNSPSEITSLTKGYEGISNLDVISVLGSVWPPVMVEIDLRQQRDEILVSIDDGSWFEGR